MDTPDDGEFDKIVSGQGGEEGSEGSVPEVEDLWDAMQQAWPKIHPGILVKGLYIVEFVDPDGHRVLRFGTSGGVYEWDMLGMLRRVLLDVESDAMSMFLLEEYEEDEDDEGGHT